MISFTVNGQPAQVDVEVAMDFAVLLQRRVAQVHALITTHHPQKKLGMVGTTRRSRRRAPLNPLIPISPRGRKKKADLQLRKLG
jgi:hypothetical protein